MIKKFNREMLQLARELRGETQTHVAEGAKLTQAYVSMLENGTKEGTDESIQRVADYLKFPMEFFYQQDRYLGLGISMVYYRKRASAQVGDLRRLQAEINLRRIQVSRLLRGLHLKTPNTMHKMDIDEHGGDAASIAQLVRASWNLKLGPIDNLVQEIERAGGIVMSFPFGTNDVDAVSQWPDDAPPFFFLNTHAPADRVRFSLAHELGHMVMHTGASEHIEEEANTFASEFLMPAKEITHQLKGIDIKKAAALKPYWRVSIAALIRRARDLGQITSATYTSLFRRMSQLGLRKNEPGPIAPEHPSYIRRILDSYQITNGYTLQDLARLSTVFEPDFTQRYVPYAGLRLAN